MSTSEKAPAWGPDRRPRRPALACGLIVWIAPEGAGGPTFYEARRVRPAGATAAYSLAKPGDAGRHVVKRTPDGLLHCTCPDFAYGQAANGPEGCKHCRALSSIGLL